MAELVKRLGYEVVVISRGYKGELEKTGGIVSNGKTVLLGPEKAGDEPFMIAGRLKNIPVIVGKNRFEAGIRAVKEFNPDVIILDDAFQHLKLKRDINLVLLDAKRPFGNSYLLPRGILREPLSSLSRSNAFIFTRTGIASGSTKSFTDINKHITCRPIYLTTHTLYIHKVVDGYKDKTCIDVSKKISFDLNILKGKRVFAFSGIAKNEDFKRSIEKYSCNIKGFVGYADHHSYSDNDLSDLLQSAMAKNVDFILTTEKDYVRIAHRIEWPIKLVVIGIKISFGKDENSFKTFISGRLKET
jgi:tetraacyldisaccharide 4'-kinase